MSECRLALLTALSTGGKSRLMKLRGQPHREVMADVGAETWLGHDPLVPWHPLQPQARPGGVGRWNKEEAALAAELLLTSQTLLFASVGSLPPFVPDNLFLCLLTYI